MSPTPASRATPPRSLNTATTATTVTTASPASAPALTKGPLEWRALLNWLTDDQLLSPQDAERVAQRFAAGDSAQHPLVRLSGMGLKRADTGTSLELEPLTEWLARRVGLPYLRIDPLKVDVARVSEVMSINYAERRKALPVQVSLTEITIATSEPLDVAWVDEILSHTKKTIKLVVSSPLDLQRFRTEFYTLAKSVKDANKKTGDSVAHNFEQLVELGKSNRQLDANDQGIIQVVDWLWQYAFDQRASDIHLEPRREMGAIRFRIDGVLHTVYQVPLAVMQAMTARIKLLGRMDVVEKRRPLDGRIKTRNPGGDEIEMRLSTMPTAFGEKLVMRIFDPDNTVKSFEALGFAPSETKIWEGLVGRPHGIILVTGPTGSGKTTTLYSTLKRVATDEVNVCTIEDPIEMIEASFNQTQVQPAIDLGFAEGVRALMRQDPDIIMVGEIRDLETAEMAIQSSLTGHLVFSTLHTNDAASAITRLTDLGVPSYLISATVIGVLAQRLVRTLCPHCKQPDTELDEGALADAIRPWRMNGKVNAYKPVGCLDCRMTGFKGRVGLYELLPVSETIRGAMHPSVDMAALRRAAAKEGLRPLRLSGVMKVAEGVTTLDEVLRNTPQWEN
nr:ATPase, T2SS/T4P/T4SS family [uncultured Aquabacterium sp.]